MSMGRLAAFPQYGDAPHEQPWSIGAPPRPARLHDGDLVSFLIQKMRITWHGNTPKGLDQPCRYQIGTGCCASRQNSGTLLYPLEHILAGQPKCVQLMRQYLEKS